jgi:hypothetical protein
VFQRDLRLVTSSPATSILELPRSQPESASQNAQQAECYEGLMVGFENSAIRLQTPAISFRNSSIRLQTPAVRFGFPHIRFSISAGRIPASDRAVSFEIGCSGV